MKTFIETPRLILREIVPSDEEGMFLLDSDPEVHRYIYQQPVKHIDEVREAIRMIRQQYIDNGIGRWAVVEKTSNEFLGWAGMKLIRTEINGHTDFYDVGYRFIRKHWGKGFATEAAKASVAYCFQTLKLPVIYGTADMENLASRKVLEKCGLKLVETFVEDRGLVGWHKLTKEEYGQ